MITAIPSHAVFPTFVLFTGKSRHWRVIFPPSNVFCRAGEMARGIRPLVHFSAPTTIHNPIYRGSDALFWPPWTLREHGTVTYMQASTHTHKPNRKETFFFQKCCFLGYEYISCSPQITVGWPEHAVYSFYSWSTRCIEIPKFLCFCFCFCQSLKKISDIWQSVRVFSSVEHFLRLWTLWYLVVIWIWKRQKCFSHLYHLCSHWVPAPCVLLAMKWGGVGSWTLRFLISQPQTAQDYSLKLGF